MRMLVLGGILVVLTLFADAYFTLNHAVTTRNPGSMMEAPRGYMDADPTKRDGVVAGGVLGSVAMIGGFGGCVVRKVRKFKESKSNASSNG